MRNVLVDLHRLGGNKFNGLYHFCEQLGLALNNITDTELKLNFYMPNSAFGTVGNNHKYIHQKSVDKIFKIGTKKFDVWHAATTLSWYKPFNKKTAFIFTIHDLNFMNENEYKASSKKKYLKLIQERVNRANHLTFISNFALSQAKEFLNIGNKDCTVIHNGCNVLNPNDAIEPIYLPKKNFLFSIGQLHSRKNFHVLFSLIRSNDYELIIAGINNTEYAKEILSIAEKIGVLDNLKLIGTVTEFEKIWYYKNCTAFAFPSVGEGFGLPVLEAMQFGKPVFLSTYTSLPEIGGENAYYFDSFEPDVMIKNFEDGMIHFNQTQPQLKLIERAKQFSYSNAAKEYINLYKKV